MRKHGWELPYHPLQVVAVAVFLALGFAFYVFFAPFVGKQLFQYIVMGIYTPLIICAFGLYIWCAGADPADPGIYRSKKYLNIPDNKKTKLNDSKHGDSNSSIPDSNDKREHDTESVADCNNERESKSKCPSAMLALLPCAYFCSSNEESFDQQSEDGMFYCSLCEVEVFKYSKHCRVCDKCVDNFDHHCRWLNNCIGKRNYRKFFTLMVSALLLLILQWSTGILVLVLCFLEKTKFATDISSKLGSSFTVAPFVIVVSVCSVLAMIATLPLAQLFFFHILLIKKGISTYDYIIALRDQEQQGVNGQQSPQMSPNSSITGLSSVSSFNTFHRAAWCTPPRLFVEDQYDVVPPDNGSVSSLGKKTTRDEPIKKNHAAVKISPWALARLNADDVAKAAAESRKRSKILRPVSRNQPTYNLETDSSYVSSRRHVGPPRPENNKKRGSRRIRLPAEIPIEPLSRIPSLDSKNNHMRNEIISSSPESSLDSPEILSLRAEESRRRLVGLSANPNPMAGNDVPLSRSTSDGYDASGGEDSDRVPSRMVHRSSQWSGLSFGSEPDGPGPNYMASSSSSFF